MSKINEGALERLRKLVEGMDLSESDVLTELIVIGKTSNLDSGKVGICYNHDTKDWVVRAGMLSAAVDIEDTTEITNVDEE